MISYKVGKLDFCFVTSRYESNLQLFLAYMVYFCKENNDPRSLQRYDLLLLISFNISSRAEGILEREEVHTLICLLYTQQSCTAELLECTWKRGGEK